jgi:hypothetical protein
MKLFDRFLRWYSPKLYIQRSLARGRRENEKKLAASGLTGQERYDYDCSLHQDLHEWYEWQTVVEDEEMIKKARKIDILMDDFPIPHLANDDFRSRNPSHYDQNDFGDRILRDESRTILRKAMRERMPAYRKERREYWELWLKAGALVMGLLGTATGFIVALKH